MTIDIAVRPAQSEDYAAVAALFPLLGTGDAIPTDERFTREMRATTWIAEAREGAGAKASVVGYAWLQHIGALCYVRHFVVAADWQGRRVGTTLLSSVVAHVRETGARTMALNVKPDNVPAVRLYASFGFTEVYASRALCIAWAQVDAVEESSPSVSVRALTPADDATAEAVFGLVPGMLAENRRTGRVLLLVEQGDAIHGLAAFDPTFPGATPFKAKTPGDAFVLLRAMKRHRRPTDDEVKVTVEGQPAVADALLAAGAELRFEIVHMRASL